MVIHREDLIMHGELWDRLSRLDEKQMAHRAGYNYEKFISVDFLNKRYAVRIGERKLERIGSDDPPVSPAEELFILSYLHIQITG